MNDEDFIEIEREIVTSQLEGNTIRFERKPVRQRLNNVLRLTPKARPRLLNILRIAPKKPPQHNILKLPSRVYTSRHKLDLSFWRREYERKRAERERLREEMLATLREKQRTTPRHLRIQSSNPQPAPQEEHTHAHSSPPAAPAARAPADSERPVPVSRLTRVAVILLVVSVNWIGLSALGSTVSYFSDSERSLGNLLAAALLDLTTSDGTGDRRTIQCGGTEEYHIAVSTHINSLTTTYAAEAEMVGGDAALCEALELKALKDGEEVYQGPLLDFVTDPQEGESAWQFLVTLPDEATHIPHKATCDVDLVFRGWCTDVELFAESGFNDIERVPLRLAKKVPGCKEKGCMIGDVEIDIDNDNNADVDNDIDVDVNTGGNSANGGGGGDGGSGGDGGNGGAGGSVDTGDATSTVDIDTDVNANETTVNIGCTAGCTSCGGCTGASTEAEQSAAGSSTDEMASSTEALFDDIAKGVEKKIAQGVGSSESGTSTDEGDSLNEDTQNEEHSVDTEEEQENEINEEPAGDGEAGEDADSREGGEEQITSDEADTESKEEPEPESEPETESAPQQQNDGPTEPSGDGEEEGEV